MWQLFFYNLFLKLYVVIARLIQRGNKKAALWLTGRKNIFDQVSAALQNNAPPNVWFHCASLGEFEQGRPLMEQIKTQFPAYKILVTFFSPSGYEAKKNDAIADWIFYLPMDSAAHAEQWLTITMPALVVFVKYEFWYYYLTAIKNKNIPAILVSGIFRGNQPFFKWYGGLHRNMLHCFQHLFVQNQDSKKLLASIGLDNKTTVAGDTRFDRVTNIALEPYQNALIEQFIQNRQVIVAGSTWTEDDEALDHFANTHPELCFIIAPHEIDEDRIAECKALYKNNICYSGLHAGIDFSGCNVLIIDNIGMLSRLYRYATICYVGGGFGEDGVHNILEAAVYGKPVVFGPVYDKFFEATALVELGGAFSIDDALMLEQEFKKLLNEAELYSNACKISGNYVQQHAGSTRGIVKYIQENLLLIN
ncbi:MAG: 3-deoxy-D-manno-octulosonic acid transferase [Hydrotalea flava]|nr:3-deoxy-D-manno-octulosonic acid transferase [Hydrotalea flava]NIM37004.1 3-deoxy-D-manno-octulosonic acid transferase [Hydrotalea flava]NIN03427.1 3-deoxy-D-manno-octulosonic acid transferase [Hydrotalea flava]NIN13849.1 3-deoxy-D-manno-octulosonic acid transferase [Hydrotalea flava]NIO92930.1 3-deoxy-D-manno-octulosonic acid transferase [Hydrotalea flava]